MDDQITSCWMYTQIEGEYYQSECPGHYWDYYDTAENCYMEECWEWSEDYECWTETCDSDWCMTYERWGDEWYEDSCDAEYETDCYTKECWVDGADSCEVEICHVDWEWVDSCWMTTYY